MAHDEATDAAQLGHGDLSVAPGVSNLEPAVTGWNADEVTRMLRAMRRSDVMGGDVVCPMSTKDQPNHITAMVAAAIMYKMVGLIADRHGKEGR